MKRTCACAVSRVRLWSRVRELSVCKFCVCLTDDPPAVGGTWSRQVSVVTSSVFLWRPYSCVVCTESVCVWLRVCLLRVTDLFSYSMLWGRVRWLHSPSTPERTLALQYVPRDGRVPLLRTIGTAALAWQGGFANTQCRRGARQRCQPDRPSKRSIYDEQAPCLCAHLTASLRTVCDCDHRPKQAPCVSGPAVVAGRRGRGVGGRQADLRRRTAAGDPESAAARLVELRQPRRRHGLPQDAAASCRLRLQRHLARAAPQQGVADHGRR